MKDVFIQITQVWAHYFKWFNRVHLTQDENALFIKGNELKLSYFHFFFLREYIKIQLTVKFHAIPHICFCSSAAAKSVSYTDSQTLCKKEKLCSKHPKMYKSVKNSTNDCSPTAQVRCNTKWLFNSYTGVFRRSWVEKINACLRRLK